MSGDFVSALDAEIANLEQALEQDVRYIRLRELKKILRFYGGATSSQSATLNKVQGMAPEGKQSRPSVRQPSPAREKALAAVKEYIRGLDRIVPTRELLEHLAASGIEVGGASPLNNLSAMISTSGMFEAHGRGGWTIKEETSDAEAAPDPSQDTALGD